MSAMPAYSVQRRLMGMALVILALCFIGLCWLSYSYAQRAADAAYDRLLQASALTIANAVQTEDGELTVELPYSAMAMLSDQEHIYYAVRSASELIAGYPDLGAGEPLANDAVTRFRTVQYQGQPVRIVTTGRLVTGNRGGNWVTIMVGETLGTRSLLVSELFGRSVLPLLIILAVALTLIGFGMRRAFSPLRTLEAELSRRSPENLQAIASDVPLEVAGLVRGLNDFMLRLKTAMGTLHSLVADAAHQIRTPLAALKMQSELALEDRDWHTLRKRLGRIHANAGHTTQLLNQLLMDATISHRQGSASMRPVAVSTLMQEVLQRLDPDIVSRVHCQVEPLAQQATILGDYVSLREMLRNVLDNALRYGGDGAVEIRVYDAGNRHAVFDVSDRGPGIPDDEKPSVLARFVRGSTHAGQVGSGLGLSIVQSVVRAHGGQLALLDRQGGGLTVRMQLPAVFPARTASQPRMSYLAVTCLLLPLWWHAPGVRAQPGTPPSVIEALAQELAQDGQAGMQHTHYPALAHDAAGSASVPLRIAGPTDLDLFQALIQDFQQMYPAVAVDYLEIDSMSLYRMVRNERLPFVDVIVSSAADLQLRLANDGYARAHTSPFSMRIPAWARWRSEVFGFTQEPVVMAYSRARVPAGDRPKSRSELLRYLEENALRLRGRVGTYDINVSGAGYLLALYDERTSSNFWGMANQLGQVGVRLYATTAEILDGLEQGHLDVAYNVLGSYALHRQKAGADIAIVVPQDYISVFTRTALILRDAPSPAVAGDFVDYLLSPRGQSATAGAGLPPLLPGDTAWRHGLLDALEHGVVQPIVLGPALLVGLDQTRRRRFIKNWTRLVTDTPDLNPAPVIVQGRALPPMTGR